jgi:hypothetical protein
MKEGFVRCGTVGIECKCELPMGTGDRLCRVVSSRSCDLYLKLIIICKFQLNQFYPAFLHFNIFSFTFLSMYTDKMVPRSQMCSGFQGENYTGSVLLDCETEWTCRSTQAFWRSMLPLFSGSTEYLVVLCKQVVRKGRSVDLPNYPVSQPRISQHSLHIHYDDMALVVTCFTSCAVQESTVYLRVSCNSHNKQQLFPQTI